MSRRARQRGFTMIEILMALSLLVIFFAISGQLLRSTLMLNWAGVNASDRAGRADFAMERLRADAWNSKSITVATPESVTFGEVGEKSVSWKIDSDNHLVRQEEQGMPQIFDGVGGKWSFSADAVSLEVSDGSASAARLVSQSLLSEGRHP